MAWSKPQPMHKAMHTQPQINTEAPFTKWMKFNLIMDK